MSSRGERPRAVRVYVEASRHRAVKVRRQRLYELVGLPACTPATRMEVGVTAGVSGYAFTFG